MGISQREEQESGSQDARQETQDVGTKTRDPDLRSGSQDPGPRSKYLKAHLICLFSRI